MDKPNTVAIIGLGYVGLPLAVLAKSAGHKVIGIDRDRQKIKLINNKESPIHDAQLAADLKKYPIRATHDVSQVKLAKIVIICVPTPVKNRTEPDLGPLKSASEAVAKNVKKGTLIIIESTINPGVCDDVIIPLIEQKSGLKIGKDLYLAHCPERINPGDLEYSVKNINRVVGAQNKAGLDMALEFYKSILNADIKPMDTIKEAEAVKVVENSFRDINIAFVNELAMSFHKLGIDIENVIDGAATKPFAFMAHRPGSGVGGHCIPVDPYYLIEYARGHGFEHDFLSLARKINSQMPEFTVQLVEDSLKKLSKPIKGARVALMGLAYKPNVGDDRESPAYEIKNILESRGAKVVTYDPYVNGSDVETLDQALKDTEVALVATAHDEFINLTPASFADASIRIVVDGRNVYRHHKKSFATVGVVYAGIGVS